MTLDAVPQRLRGAQAAARPSIEPDLPLEPEENATFVDPLCLFLCPIMFPIMAYIDPSDLTLIDLDDYSSSRAPRVGHKKSRKGCAQCKKRHVKVSCHYTPRYFGLTRSPANRSHSQCNEEAPCSNCVRHGVACSLAGGPYVTREDAKPRRRTSNTSSSSHSRAASHRLGESSRSTSPFGAPYAVLTGLIDRPLADADSSKAWALDVELMHHYMTHTKYILPQSRDAIDILRIWQEETPRIAFAHEYVLHAMLGFTALHKAHLEPDQARKLHTYAVDHFDKAFVLYRHSGPASAENAEAKFIFIWLAAFFAMAVPPSVQPIDAMVELLLLIRGVELIVSETWHWVSKGPYAPIFSRSIREGVTAPPDAYVNFPPSRHDQ